MLQKLTFVIPLSLFLSSCAITHNKYSKGGNPMEIKAECIKSTIIGNAEYTQKKNKKGNILFTYEGVRLSVVYSETNLVVSSANVLVVNSDNATESEKLIETVNLVWRNLANSCKKESAYPIIYQ